MRKKKKTTFDGQDITITELSVEEITNIMEKTTKRREGVVDLMFPARMPIEGVALTTGLKTEELMQAAPSELDALFGEVEEVNPFFVKMCQALFQDVPAPSDAGILKKPASN